VEGGRSLPSGKTPQDVHSCLKAFARVVKKRHAREVERKDFRRYVEHELGRGLQPKTVDKKVGHVRAVFNHAVKTDLLPSNPGANLYIPRPKQAAPSRLPFETEQLQAILDSSFFRPRRGRRHCTPGRGWMVLLGLYQGARLEELAQLRLDDVKAVNGVWCLKIHADGTGQRLKNAASRRTLPVHRAILNAGFLAYLVELRQRGERRLFPEFSADAHGRYGSTYSKAFSRLQRVELGLKDRRLVFHSLRHSFEDACREAELDGGVIDALMGHAPNYGRGYQYGSGDSVRRLKEAIDRIEYPGLEVPVFEGEDYVTKRS